jgi:prepilin-type N-terminal cleavage/methylation domain-containing protein
MILVKKKRGFTLLELSVVLLLVSALLVVVANSDEIIGSTRIYSAKSITKSSPITRMSNLVVWYETTMDQSFETEVDDNFPIDRWNNLSPEASGNNAISPASPTLPDPQTDRLPLYSEFAINGLPALEFQGEDVNANNRDYFTFNGDKIANSNYTVFVVEQRLNANDNKFFISGDGGSSLDLGYLDSGTLQFYHNNAGIGDDLSFEIGVFTQEIPRIHSFQFHQTIGREYFLNGNKEVSDSGVDALASYENAQIGRNAESADFYTGHIGEIIIFNKYLNNDDRIEVENYLSQKWKINLNN